MSLNFPRYSAALDWGAQAHAVPLAGETVEELVNFSVYPGDTNRFNDDWSEIERYVRAFHLNGLELLTGYEPVPAAIPKHLVAGVHLPFLTAWLDVWRGVPGAVERYYPTQDTSWADFLSGGRTPEAMIEAQRRLWINAAPLEPAYAVFHISHVEPAHAFTKQTHYCDADIIDAVADLLNAPAATFEDGRPPVRLAFENVWWPGLTFNDNAIAERLAARLNFDNWCFVLDTAHLMNTNWELRSEEQAIDFVLYTLLKLSDAVRERIEVIHLNFSQSGVYQICRLKEGLESTFYHLPFEEQFTLVRNHASQIDQHQPFTSPRCREIVEVVKPSFVTHEFTSLSTAELSEKLRVQLAAFHAEEIRREA